MKNLILALIFGTLVGALSQNGFAAPQSDEGALNSTDSWCVTPRIIESLAQRTIRTSQGIISAVDVQQGVIKIDVDSQIPVADATNQPTLARSEANIVEVALNKATLLQKITLSAASNQTTDATRSTSRPTAQIEAISITDIKVGQRASFSYVLPLTTDALLEPMATTSAKPPTRVTASALFVAQERVALFGARP